MPARLQRTVETGLRHFKEPNAELQEDLDTSQRGDELKRDPVVPRSEVPVMLDAKSIADQVKSARLDTQEGWVRYFGRRNPRVEDIQPNTYSFEPSADGRFKGSANVVVMEMAGKLRPTLASDRVIATLAGRVVGDSIVIESIQLNPS